MTMSHRSLTTNVITDLLRIPKFGTGIGLHRGQYLLDQGPLRDWRSQVNTIKITGSNGKGSVCTMVAAILQEIGLTVGLYTSPHLFDFTERIRINGIPISLEALQTAAQWTQRQIEQYQRVYPQDHYGAFEVFTAVAAYHFAQNQIHTVVAEAGIGGRYDTTRLLPGPVAALTSLDLEHTQILGSTLEQIAYDKADLCPSGGTLVVGTLDPEVLRRLTAYCSLRTVTLIRTDQVCACSTPRYHRGQMVFDFHYRDRVIADLRLAALGQYQVQNAALAIVLADQWLQRCELDFTPIQFTAAVRRALAQATIPGRLQRIWDQPEIYVDVGHSPDAIVQLVRSIQGLWPSAPWLLVTGVSYDKNVEGVLAPLAPLATQAICTRAGHKGSDVDGIVACLQSLRPELPLHRAATIEDAVTIAQALASQQNLKVLVAGGLFLAAEFTQALQGKDPQALHFL